MLEVAKVVPLLPGVMKYRSYTVGRVIERKKKGSPNKDLFHYLVSNSGFGYIQMLTDETADG
jgi:hypothetical protein